jgi:hypothetical protein
VYFIQNDIFIDITRNWRRVQVTELLIMELSPKHLSPHLSLNQIFSSPFPQTPSVHVIPYCWTTSLTPIQNHRQNYSFAYSNSYVFSEQTGKQKILDRIAASLTRIRFSLFCVHYGTKRSVPFSHQTYILFYTDSVKTLHTSSLNKL